MNFLVLIAALSLPFAAPAQATSPKADIQTFDLMPTNDSNSLQVALYQAMKAIYDAGGGDSGFNISQFGPGSYAMNDKNGVNLTCIEFEGRIGCGFTFEGADKNPDPNILDIGPSTDPASVQSGVLQFLIVYMTMMGPVQDLAISLTASANNDSYFFETSTANVTTIAELAADGLSISYGLKIELL